MNTFKTFQTGGFQSVPASSFTGMHNASGVEAFLPAVKRGGASLFGGSSDGLNGGINVSFNYGTTGSDVLTIRNGETKPFYALSGNDMIWGSDGNDTIYGGLGADTLSGGEGHDMLYGGDGKDALHGGSGNDNLTGGEDDDLLSGGTGNDNLYGNAGNDSFSDGVGRDFLRGDEGNDTFTLTADGTNKYWIHIDEVSGGEGTDTVILNAKAGTGVFFTDALGYQGEYLAPIINWFSPDGQLNSDMLLGIENVQINGVTHTLGELMA